MILSKEIVERKFEDTEEIDFDKSPISQEDFLNKANKEIVDFALWVENKKPKLEQIADWIKKHTK